MKQQLFMNESGIFFFWVGLIYELLSLEVILTHLYDSHFFFSMALVMRSCCLRFVAIFTWMFLCLSF